MSGYDLSRAPQGAPVPLKPGEEHCPYCGGYGYLPIERNNPRESMGYKRCCGTGKLWYTVQEDKRNEN